MLELIDARLIGWGRWLRLGVDGATGYPRKTLEARLRDEGGVLISGTGPRPAPIDSEAEEVDRLVQRLGQHRPDWMRMLILHYRDDYTLDEVARSLRVSESTIRAHWLKQTKFWLAGALDRKAARVA